MTDILSDHKFKMEISQHREFSKFYVISDNPGQKIDDTFPNIVIFLAHCYYIEQTSPIPPTDPPPFPHRSMLFCCFHFLQIQHCFGGEGVN